MAVGKSKLRSEYKIHNWTLEYYSAVKRENLSFVEMWMDLESSQ